MNRLEVEAIINAADPKTWADRRDSAMLTFLYNTGALVSEAINLRVGNAVLESAPGRSPAWKGANALERAALELNRPNLETIDPRPP